MPVAVASGAPTKTYVVGRVDAGTATLLGRDLHYLQVPSLLLPNGVCEGTVVSLSLERRSDDEERRYDDFVQLQDRLLRDLGQDFAIADLDAQSAHNSIKLSWKPMSIDHDKDQAQARWLLTMNDETTPRVNLPYAATETTVDGLQPDTQYTFVLSLSSPAGQFRSPTKYAKTLSLHDFSSLVVTFSLFDEPERERHTQQLRELGARVVDEPCDEVTHLVCRAPAGKRYEWACSRGRVRIVTAAWIERCAATGLLQDERSFGLDVYIAGHQL